MIDVEKLNSAKAWIEKLANGIATVLKLKPFQLTKKPSNVLTNLLKMMILSTMFTFLVACFMSLNY